MINISSKFLPLVLMLVFLTLWFISVAQDQESRFVHSISVQTGFTQIKEENLHPKVSSGIITGLIYSSEKQTQVMQEFHFIADYSRVKTQLEDLSKSIYGHLNLDYSYCFPLVEKEQYTYYLGPEIRSVYNFAFYPNWDESHLYWADYFSIGPRSVFTVDFKNNNQWNSSLTFPLFSIFSRPQLYRLYKIDDVDVGGIAKNLNSKFSAAHLTNVFFINFQTEYLFPVFKNKYEAFFYSFNYQRVKHKDGNPFSQLSHQVGIKLYL